MIKHKRAHWIRPPGPVGIGTKIGLLGGSFNPAHEGHVHISEVALKRFGLDYVWWLVAPQNPLKSSVGMAPLEDRLSQAVECARHPRIRVMDLERELATRYTIDTLKALDRRFPGARFVWLMGSDNLKSFRHWRHWSDIVARVPIAVVMRPGTVLASLNSAAIERFRGARVGNEELAGAKPPAISIADGPRNSQSATAIRAGASINEALVQSIPTC